MIKLFCPNHPKIFRLMTIVSFIPTCIDLYLQCSPKIIRKRKIRKFRAINTTQFSENSTKHETVLQFWTPKCLRQTCPSKREKVTILPWFTERSCHLKTRYRSGERRSRGNKTADNDHAFRYEKWACRKHLRYMYNKYKHINSKITNCGKDESKMYKLVFELTGRTNSNPMPPNISDESQADGFSSLFMDNIITICKTLDNIEKFDPNLGS